MGEIVLLNDTSAWHVGSAATMRVLRGMLADAGIGVAESFATNDLNPDMIEMAGLADVAGLVVNGEGSLHDVDIHYATKDHADDGTRAWPRAMLDWMRAFRDAGKPVALINAMWCRMGAADDCHLALMGNALNVFRDPLSSSQGAHMGDAAVYPDLSLLSIPGPRGSFADGPVGYGLVPDTWGVPDRHMVPRVPADADDTVREVAWDQFLEYLSGLGCYVTMEHHGALAAMALGVPCVPISADGMGVRRGWKMEGLCQMARVPWVTDIPMALEGSWVGNARRTATRHAPRAATELAKYRERMAVDYPRMLGELFGPEETV